MADPWLDVLVARAILYYHRCQVLPCRTVSSDDTLSYSYKSKHEFPERLNPLPAVIWLMFPINQKKDESTNREMDSLVDVNVSSKIPKSKPMTHALHKSKLSHKHDFKILLHHYRYLDSFCWLLLLN